MNNLEWFVWQYDINSKEIKTWNIFNHARFNDGIQRALVDYRDNKTDFTEALKSNLIYCFWCKSEYEILLSPWVGTGQIRKIDIYQQVMLNWEAFVEYVWGHRE